MNQQNTPQVDPNLLNMMAKAQSQQSSSFYSVPTMLVDLPSRGLLYPEGHPLKGKETIEIKYMTTKEEDILLNSSYIEKGVVLDRLLASVILDNKVKVESLLSGDKVALQIACRTNAYGEQYEFNYVCSSCEAKNQSSVDLSKLVHSDIDFDKIKSDGGILIELPVSKKTIKARILTGADEEKIVERIKQKKRHGFSEQFIIERYRQVFESIDGDTDPMLIAAFVQNMSIRDSRYFMKEYSKLLPTVEFVFCATCNECDHENKGGVPVGLSFFYPE